MLRLRLTPKQEAWFHWLEANAPDFLERHANILRAGDELSLIRLKSERAALWERFEATLLPQERQAY